MQLNEFENLIGTLYTLQTHFKINLKCYKCYLSIEIHSFNNRYAVLVESNVQSVRIFRFLRTNVLERETNSFAFLIISGKKL